MLPVIDVKNISKTFGKREVVNNISFSLYPGQIFGFVGPNGAGKTTTLRMITGLTQCSNGSIRIEGYSIDKSFETAISKIGAVIETPELYPYLSGEKNLKIFASFYGKKAIKRIPEIVKLVGMENRIKDKVSTYSLGMKQRLGIAQALLNRPKLLILDEPTNGLDPNGIIEMRNILKILAEKENMTIIISSHNLAELEHVCDVIGFINNGSLVDFKSMKEIKAIIQAKQRVQLVCNYPSQAAKLLFDKFKLKSKVVGNSVILPLKSGDIPTVISYLNHKNVKIYEIKKIKKSLESLYLELLNKSRPSSSIV